jgi:hypothetical protein
MVHTTRSIADECHPGWLRSDGGARSWRAPNATGLLYVHSPESPASGLRRAFGSL